MAEELSDILKNFSKMLNNKDSSNDFKEFISSIGNQSNNNTNISSNSDSPKGFSDFSNNGSNNLNFDIDNLLKMKKILDSLNNDSTDNRSNLLKSLKPYLRNSKQEKLDQYMQMLRLVTILESVDIKGFFKKNE